MRRWDGSCELTCRPRITFGMIVLNGEPFTRYNLRTIYPFAYQIIVVEGASPLAEHMATPDGHSVDCTLEALQRFSEEEDPDNKVTIVTAEDEGYANGFWPGGKDEQSRAYARRAKGDWLWQIDIDEFYLRGDLEEIRDLLQEAEPAMVFFYLRNFMYDTSLQVCGTDPEFSESQPIARVFRWRKGYRYSTHRPPTVVDEDGRSLRTLCEQVVSADETRRRNWYIWHYPYLYRQQFLSKARYYDRHRFRPSMVEWARAARDMEQGRFSVAWRGLSWLQPTTDLAPEQVTAMHREFSEYHVPTYASDTRYLCIVWLLSKYLSLLRFVRVSLLGRLWFSRTYGPCQRSFPRSSAGDWPASDRSPVMKAIIERLKSSRMYELAHHLGLVGYKPY